MNKIEDGVTEAAKRLALLRTYIEGKATLTKVADAAGIPLRTARRWVARMREGGSAALGRNLRTDAGARPRLSITTIHRRVDKIAEEKGLQPPSYASVHSIIGKIDPAILTLAHEGEATFRDRYELIHHHRAERPNATWQANHTQLDIMILDANGAVVRPWLTTVIDDHPRAVAGYMVFLGARQR